MDNRRSLKSLRNDFVLEVAIGQQCHRNEGKHVPSDKVTPNVGDHLCETIQHPLVVNLAFLSLENDLTLHLAVAPEVVVDPGIQMIQSRISTPTKEVD